MPHPGGALDDSVVPPPLVDCRSRRAIMRPVSRPEIPRSFQFFSLLPSDSCWRFPTALFSVSGRR